MSDFLISVATQYGLVGLFIASLIASTAIIPFATEVLLPVFSRMGFHPIFIVIAATTGSLMGTWINYLFGYMGSAAIKPKQEGVERVKKMMDRYGWFGLFAIIVLPLPLPVDIITIFGGLGRMNFPIFSVTIFLAKLVRYSIVTGLAELFIR